MNMTRKIMKFNLQKAIYNLKHITIAIELKIHKIFKIKQT